MSFYFLFTKQWHHDELKPNQSCYRGRHRRLQDRRTRCRKLPPWLPSMCSSKHLNHVNESPVSSTHTTISFYPVLPACDGRPLCHACFCFLENTSDHGGHAFCCSRGMPTNCSMLCLLKPLRPLWLKPSSVALSMLPAVLLRPLLTTA
jgi:hypothetical protein